MLPLRLNPLVPPLRQNLVRNDDLDVARDAIDDNRIAILDESDRPAVEGLGRDMALRESISDGICKEAGETNDDESSTRAGEPTVC